MWLPTPIYERLPQFWLLLGLLFMTSGTYLGFDYTLSFFYFGLGLVCCVWSMWVFSARLRHRGDATEQGPAESQTAEQTHPDPTEAEPTA